jgi:hypothetical protein
MLMIRSIVRSRSTVAAALVLSMLIPTSRAYAKEPEARPRVAPLTLRESAIEHARKAALEPSPSSQTQVTRAQAPKRERSTTRKIFGAALGATAGLFAGGYLGAVIEGDSCHCDDPGLQGALIGAPVGMVLGGILGAVFF